MSTYRMMWPCCGCDSETDNLELDVCPFCNPAPQPAALADDSRRLLAWAYRKLMPFTFAKLEDNLAMDEIKLLLTENPEDGTDKPGDDLALPVAPNSPV